MIRKFHYQMYPSHIMLNNLNESIVSMTSEFDYYLKPSHLEELTKGTFVESPYTKELILKTLMSAGLNVSDVEHLSDIIRNELLDFVNMSNGDEDVSELTQFTLDKLVGRAWGRLQYSSVLTQHSLLDSLRISAFIKKNPEMKNKLYPGLKLGNRDLEYKHRIIDHVSFGMITRSSITLDTESTMTTTGTTMEEIIGEVIDAVSTVKLPDIELKNAMQGLDLHGNITKLLKIVKDSSLPVNNKIDNFEKIQHIMNTELSTMWTSQVTNVNNYGKLHCENVMKTTYRMLSVLSLLSSYDMNHLLKIAGSHHESLNPSKYSMGSMNNSHIRDTINSMNLYVNSIVEMSELSLLNNPSIYNYDRVRTNIIKVNESKNIIENNSFEFNTDALNTLVMASYVGSSYVIGKTEDFIESYKKFINETYHDSNVVYTEIGNDRYSYDSSLIIDMNGNREKITESSLLFGLSTFLPQIDVTDYGIKQPYGTFRTFSSVSPEVLVISDIISMIQDETYIETLPKYCNLELNDTTLDFYKELSGMVSVMFNRYLDDKNNDYDLYTIHKDIIKSIGEYTKYFNIDGKYKEREVVELILADYTDAFSPMEDMTVSNSHQYTFGNATVSTVELFEHDETTENDKYKVTSGGGFRKMFIKKDN